MDQQPSQQSQQQPPGSQQRQPLLPPRQPQQQRPGGGPGGQQPNQPTRPPWRNWVNWILVAILVVWNIFLFWPHDQPSSTNIPYSTFVAQVAANNVTTVKITGEDIIGSFATPVVGSLLSGTPTPGTGTPAPTTSTSNATFANFETTFPDTVGDTTLIPLLREHNVLVNVSTPSTPWFISLLGTILPFALLIGALAWMGRQAARSQQGVFGFGRTQARKYTQDRPTITFNDVAGADEAKQDLTEEVDFLRVPEKYHKLGAHIPRGTLLIGPPGTGKTLLARAVAGEAAVPFFSISGSEFVQMFVGVGASRVRDLFAQAKEASPSIIFIDELDAVGRKRGSDNFGTNDEREQTLNQLLVEMDGFDERQEVIVLAATNRPDVLDPALLRPGRFDRQVEVPLPERKGREGILRIHARPLPLAPDVNISEIAGMSVGFSGADLANLCNEAALDAARVGNNQVGRANFIDALDKIRLGGVRPLMLSEQDRRITAYHEAGHTVVAWRSPGADPVGKVTIIPRGRALGVTEQVPGEDRYNYSLSYLTSRLAIMVGGRVAEEIVFGDITTGAQSDLTQATGLARNMVTQWGMGSIGLTSYQSDDQGGYDSLRGKPYSDETASRIDADVTRILDDAHKAARELLTNARSDLDRLVDALLKSETVYSDGLAQILGPQPAAPDLTPKDIAPEGKVLVNAQSNIPTN